MAPTDRQKVTLNLPRDLVRSYRIAAARRGVRDQDLVEEALRRHLGLGAVERARARLAGIARSASTAERIAAAEVRATRSRKR